MTILISTTAVNARSAELEILARENLEAERYKNQIQEQSKAMNKLNKHVKSLRNKARIALEAAKTRDAALTEVLKAEQLLADSKVGIYEYRQVDYEFDATGKETLARLK